MFKILLLAVFLMFNWPIETILKSICNGKDLAKPHFESVEFNTTDGNINFSAHGYKFAIQTDPDKPAIIYVYQKSDIIDTIKVSYPIWDHYFDEIISCDIDSDSVKEIFVISYPVGATGYSGNVHLIGMIKLNTINNEIVFQELNSFFGDKENFFDINDDGKYEYICIDLCELNFYEAHIFMLEENHFVSGDSSSEFFPLKFAIGGEVLHNSSCSDNKEKLIPKIMY